MANKTSNLSTCGAKKGKRRLSREARRAMAEAGERNLRSWHERAQETAGNAITDIETFRADLLAELGANPSVTRRALAENAVMTYASIVLVNKELLRKRSKERARWIERASWLSGNLTRVLKTLSLDAKPRPRSLAELLGTKVEQTDSNDPAKPAISTTN